MRIAVLSDVHSNLVALEAVLRHAGSFDGLWVSGDLVGYGPEPQAVVDRLRREGAIAVRGNHDDAAGGGESIELFNSDGYDAMVWTRSAIDEPTRLYLASLPERVVQAELGVTIAHGSPLEPIWEYLDSTAAVRHNLPVLDTRHGLVGHTHVPLVFREAGASGCIERLEVKAGKSIALDDRRVIVNPGSVGQPRDGDPRASYLTIDTDRARLTWHRVAYEIGRTQRAMAEVGLPVYLAERLNLGR